MSDLLWSDPEKVSSKSPNSSPSSTHVPFSPALLLQGLSGWGPNDRGVSFTFGEDVVQRFLDKHELHVIW